MVRDRSLLDQAIRRSGERGTYYWYFMHKYGKGRRREHEVEVRVDVPLDHLIDLKPPQGWTIVETKPADGMVYMRRRQALRDKDLRQMFTDILTFAFEHSGKFHSWTHETALLDSLARDRNSEQRQ